MVKTFYLDVSIIAADGQLRLNLALRQIPTIHEKNLVLESIVSGYRDTPWETSKEETLLDQWAQDRFGGALKTLDIVEEIKGRALISIGKKYGRALLMNG